ncbi:esterase-like activity of phytase family protein [Erythrobacter insulae]|uniref:Esterase-like activity of phytase family protein n=1 Tax=Erythrobacter insulae TaxID=2584124 RepID=A0A547PAX8_9SPHN|nr:esterase-like activity of phytase family protein [Erythrobacter insulae]TRD11301.1 esterase-like activity of phytase family protein [Erythrobacter insulae]
MKSARRVIAAITVACLCAPGTWLRTPVSWDPPATLKIEQVQQAGDTGVSAWPGWSVAGVWHYSGQSLLFGGFSALAALPDQRLMAFSDRGARFTLSQPDTGISQWSIDRQKFDLPLATAIPDAEAAAIDSDGAQYWLALENAHGIYRFDRDNTASGSIKLHAAALGWTNNTGAEAMARLQDGRFAILPEGRRIGLIFAGDPIETRVFKTFAYLPPIPGHAATDMAQLPDGRVLLLLRNLDPSGGIPVFESKLAVGPAPDADGDLPWAPQITLDLAGVIPRENYEGIALREMADGRVAVWLISDDNLSVMQRTLLAKLIFDPAEAAPPE